MIYNDPMLRRKKAKTFLVKLSSIPLTSYNSGYAHVVIDGVKYVVNSETVELQEGTVIDCVAKGSTEGYSKVIVNGVTQTLVAGDDTDVRRHYYYTVHSDITIFMSSSGFPGGNTANIEIVEGACLFKLYISPKTISVEVGMTWADWCVSEYNTLSCTLEDDGTITFTSTSTDGSTTYYYRVVNKGGEAVYGSDLIVENASYSAEKL